MQYETKKNQICGKRTKKKHKMTEILQKWPKWKTEWQKRRKKTSKQRDTLNKITHKPLNETRNDANDHKRYVNWLESEIKWLQFDEDYYKEAKKREQSLWTKLKKRKNSNLLCIGKKNWKRESKWPQRTKKRDPWQDINLYLHVLWLGLPTCLHPFIHNLHIFGCWY